MKRKRSGPPASAGRPQKRTSKSKPRPSARPDASFDPAADLPPHPSGRPPFPGKVPFPGKAPFPGNAPRPPAPPAPPRAENTESDGDAAAEFAPGGHVIVPRKVGAAKLKAAKAKGKVKALPQGAKKKAKPAGKAKVKAKGKVRPGSTPGSARRPAPPPGPTAAAEAAQLRSGPPVAAEGASKTKDKGSKQRWTVPADAHRLTLAGALRAWLEGFSWGQVRRLIQTRRIQVAGNVCVDAGRRLRPGELVAVMDQSAAPPPGDDRVKIVYHDSQIVIVEKPSGLTSTRHHEERDWAGERKQFQPTLDEMLPKILAQRGVKGSRRGGLPTIRAVHRLDRETSGVMVFARTVDAERHLGQQFRKHTIHRCYYALVHGQIEPQRIESTLVRDRGDGRRGSTKLPNAGKWAATNVEVIERLGDYTLVACMLETGRTHQIRIHLSEAGHPVCGDRVYRQPFGKTVIPDRSGARRVLLHAAEIGIVHPDTGEELEFETQPPKDFMLILEEFRNASRARGDRTDAGRPVGARPPRPKRAPLEEAEFQDDEDEEEFSYEYADDESEEEADDEEAEDEGPVELFDEDDVEGDEDEE